MEENFSTFLADYADEAASVAKNIAKDYNLTLDQAIKIVEIATRNLMADSVEEVANSIYDLSETVAVANDVFDDDDDRYISELWFQRWVNNQTIT